MEIAYGSCHCGKVKFEVMLEQGLSPLLRCNCSLCRRKGALMCSVPVKNLLLTEGEENLALYQWNTHTAKHYFCKTCGIYTHHQRRIDPGQFGFNVACIEGVDLSSLTDISLVDGASL